MMRGIFFLSVLLFLGANAKAQQNAPADEQRGTRVAFVDMGEVIASSEAIQAGMTRLEKSRQGRWEELARLERELARKRYEADLQSSVLSEEERQKRRGELIDLQAEIERLRFAASQDELRQDLMLEPVLEYVMVKVADVAEEEGFDLVLRGEVVLWGNKPHNLTERVAKALDAEEEKVKELFGASMREKRPAPPPQAADEAPASPEDEDGLPLIP